MINKITRSEHPEIHFKEALLKAQEEEKKAQKTFNLLAVLRLLSFLSILTFAWLWNKTGAGTWGLILAALVLVFLYLMRRQQIFRRLRDYQRNLQIINEDELQRLSFRFTRKENGSEYQKKDHPYASDLDIFGDYSLYKLLNRTRTAAGSRRLSRWLKAPAPLEEILMRQEASAEFSTRPDWRQNWEAIALLHKNADQQIGSFQVWLHETLPQELVSSLKWRFWPVVTVVLGILAGFNLLPVWPLALSLLWHLLILKRYQLLIQTLTSKTTALGQTLVAYAELLEQAEGAPCSSRWWKERKSKIAGSHDALLQAGKLFDKLDFRNNPYFAIFVGIPTLWDLHCLAGLEGWKTKHAAHLQQWLDVLADAEAMNSIAGFRFANPAYTIPQITWDNGMSIETNDLGHPLIRPEKRISNTFQMNGLGQTVLITGSNMSGKSTFLRTVGLNIVLAQTGAVVCASSFSCSPARVFSSMRTQDSLEESTSSFYAELKRLRQLLEISDENEKLPVFYLLDEILKGTNSADRHRGAEALIRQLHSKRSAGMVSTHDLELGEWGAQADFVHNFHFRSDVEDGQLKFDYKLYDGICRSFNASELMRMMGIDIDMQNQ